MTIASGWLNSQQCMSRLLLPCQPSQPACGEYRPPSDCSTMARPNLRAERRKLLQNTRRPTPDQRLTMSPDAAFVDQTRGMQGDGEILASVQFRRDETWMQDRLAAHLAFWKGDAAPSLVLPTEAIKCRSCLFQAQCPGGAVSRGTRVTYE